MLLDRIFKAFLRKFSPGCRGWPTLCIAFLLIFDVSSLLAARNRPSYEEDRNVMIREILDSLDNLRHQVNNHEAEIRVFEEKFKNQEDILDSLRKQTAAATQAVKEALRGHLGNLEAKLAGHENTAKDLSTDFKSFAKDYSHVLIEYKSRIADLEKAIDIQNHNIENLQAAMGTLIEAIQVKETLQEKSITPIQDESSAKIYRVKAGDSLGKIAEQNQTTIKKLKELNNLTSDQIIIGQKLKLSE